MIQYLTECKTYKIVIHKVEWNTDRITEVEKQYKLGEQSLHKTKRQALEYIERMKVDGIDVVFIGKYISRHRRVA